MDEKFTLYQNRFIWNNEKNELNKKKHKISFEEATGVFDDPFAYEVFDEKHSREEDRFRVTGVTGNVKGRFITVSVTHPDEIIRIFSARDAEPKEIKEYNNVIRAFFGK